MQTEADGSAGKPFHYFYTKQALFPAIRQRRNREVTDRSAGLAVEGDPPMALGHLMTGIWQSATAILLLKAG